MNYNELFYAAIEVERKKQDEKWGVQEHGGHAWMGILTEEVGELAKAINEDSVFDIEDELIQVVAVCKAMWEQHGHNRLRPQFGIRKEQIKDDEHILEVRDDGWSLQHPLECRPNLLDCAMHHTIIASQCGFENFEDYDNGRYLCIIDSEGSLVLTKIRKEQ